MKPRVWMWGALLSACSEGTGALPPSPAADTGAPFFDGGGGPLDMGGRDPSDGGRPSSPDFEIAGPRGVLRRGACLPQRVLFAVDELPGPLRWSMDPAIPGLTLAVSEGSDRVAVLRGEPQGPGRVSSTVRVETADGQRSWTELSFDFLPGPLWFGAWDSGSSEGPGPSTLRLVDVCAEAEPIELSAPESARIELSSGARFALAISSSDVLVADLRESQPIFRSVFDSEPGTGGFAIAVRSDVGVLIVQTPYGPSERVFLMDATGRVQLLEGVHNPAFNSCCAPSLAPLFYSEKPGPSPHTRLRFLNSGEDFDLSEFLQGPAVGRSFREGIVISTRDDGLAALNLRTGVVRSVPGLELFDGGRTGWWPETDQAASAGPWTFRVYNTGLTDFVSFEAPSAAAAYRWVGDEDFAVGLGVDLEERTAWGLRSARGEVSYFELGGRFALPGEGAFRAHGGAPIFVTPEAAVVLSPAGSIVFESELELPHASATGAHVLVAPRIEEVEVQDVLTGETMGPFSVARGRYRSAFGVVDGFVWSRLGEALVLQARSELYVVVLRNSGPEVVGRIPGDFERAFLGSVALQGTWALP
ncbi:MAG: hypothetical protein AAF851_06205 [Myxococcota bacterium]